LYAAARHRAEFLHLIGDETVDGGRWHRTDWNKPDSTACNFVWINKWVE
jgi:hypothetical protein